MRLSAPLLVVAIAGGALAAPLGRSQQKRGLSCPSSDDTGSALKSTGTDGENVVCTYATAGDCEYFNENGTFSSGASICPKGLESAGASSSSSSSSSTSSTTTSSSTTSKATSTSTSASTSATTSSKPTANPSLSCPSTDLKGSKLTSTGTDGENVVCNYQESPGCEYFDENGTFSSGSSTCPKGLVTSTSSTSSSSASVSATSAKSSSTSASTSTSTSTTSTKASSSSSSSSTSSSSSSSSTSSSASKSSSSSSASASSSSTPPALSSDGVFSESSLAPQLTSPASASSSPPATTSAAPPPASVASITVSTVSADTGTAALSTTAGGIKNLNPTPAVLLSGASHSRSYARSSWTFGAAVVALSAVWLAF